MTSEVTAVPPLWQIEFRLSDLISKQTSISRDSVTPSSRLLEDLHIDSLDLVELIMAVEEEFCVSIPDDLGKQMFVREPVTVAVLAEIVQHQWGTGEPPRRGWLDSHPAPALSTVVPFTQVGGKVSQRDWLAGPLYQSMAATPQGFAQFRRRTDGMRCVLIPKAEVEIGDDEGAADQQPRHRAEIAAFLIDAEPVSVTAYTRFLNSLEGSSPPVVASWLAHDGNDRRAAQVQVRFGRSEWKAVPGTEHQPIVLVSWFGANAYSLWANRVAVEPGETQFSQSFLPTEAQWEYAARGAVWQEYPWGHGPAATTLALCHQHTARHKYGGILPLAAVNANLGLSPFGLHHMAGNVWQWCADFYDASFYASAEARTREPCCRRHTGVRVERGGSWIGPAELMASSYRRGRPPLARGRCLGFRCIGSVFDLP